MVRKTRFLQKGREKVTEGARNGTDEEKQREVDGRVILDDFPSYPLTDIGSSKLYADMFKRELRFVRGIGKYFFYNGKVWVKDDGGIYARRLAKKFAIETVKKASEIPDDKTRETYVRYYNKFNGYNVREKLVKDAQTVYLMEYSEFDNRPELYNCQNGTFNLKTGKLQAHNADDMLTQISNVVYDADAECERWKRFIDEIMESDKQRKCLLQMIAGYCLSGSTRFECFFMLYGKTTRNGKGTFNSTLMKMHGDYAQALQPDSLSVKGFYSNGEAPNESIASLAGKRYVCVSEPGENLVLNSDLIKALTGGDPIRARFLKEHFFTYIPCFKIVINTNYLPKIFDDTVFESNRVVLVSFDVHYDLSRRDDTLKDRFVKEKNLSGIFNWCYEGYRMLERSGTLNVPDKSKLLFDYYRDKSDVAKQFISECLMPIEGARLKFKSAYDRYQEWARDNGYKPYNRGNFKEKMGKHVEVKPYRGQECIFDYDFPENIPFLT